jgi:hypothetical protein
MLLRYALKLETEANAVEGAIERTLRAGIGTTDVFPAKPVGTRDMAQTIAAAV